MVLDRPEIPLHTNGSENDIRCQVNSATSVAEPTATSVATAATRFAGSLKQAKNKAMARLREMMLASTRIFADETVVPVLDPGRGRTKHGYFWAVTRGAGAEA